MGNNLTGQTIASTYEDLVQISGSILTDGLGNDITNLTITASSATTASFAVTAISANTVTSASYALTASFALNGGGGATVDTGSLMTTGSVSSNTLTFTKGDGSTFDLVVATGSAVTTDTGSLLTTASISNDTITFTKGDASTFNIVVNNVSNASTASIATFATSAGTASLANTATLAVSASHATTASYALNADNAISASFATSASYATTASHALGLADGLNINANTVTASAAQFTTLVATSASFGYVNVTTGSAVIIGDSFIIVNADTPIAPFAGIKVYDTGSASTASIEWNGNADIWITVEENGDSAMILTGLSGSKGSEIAPALNKLLKGTGNNTVADSSITDDGSSVLIESNTTVSVNGATADLVVTSDDDFTYASTLRIGGGSGGAGNGFYLSNFNDTSSVTTDNGLLSIALGGTLQLQGLNYPSTDGNPGEFLVTDGTGSLSFATASFATPTLQEVTTAGASTDQTIQITDSTTGNTLLTPTSVFLNSVDNTTPLELSFTDNNGFDTSGVRFDPATFALDVYTYNNAPISLKSPTQVTGSLRGEVNALSIASQTASMDLSTGNFFTLELPNADTHLVPSNTQAGQTVNLKVTHTSTSSGSLAFSDSFLFAGGTAFEVTPATSSVDVMTFISFNGSTLEATGLKNFS